LALCLLGARAFSQTNTDRVLAPYFVVQGDAGGQESFPLQATQVHFDISGSSADVTVEQTYQNRGPTPISAEYVFPASSRAAVHGLTMRLKDRVIRAQIKEREQARKTYEQAKQSGKSASLLEQHRPNVFQMSVANILPDEQVHVELHYTELLVPTSGTYELVFPTVVGPRYSAIRAQDARPTDAFIESPYLHRGVDSPAAFDISGSVSAGIPLEGLGSASHAIQVRYTSPTRAVVTLDPKESAAVNRDFVLRYTLEGRAIQSGLSLYEGKDESYFMLMVQPPKLVTTDEMPPREYVLIVDVSGSMMGFPLQTAKVLMRQLASGLRPQDSFNLLLFSGAFRLMAPASIQATPGNIAAALEYLDRERGGGGTELRPALLKALSLPRQEGISRTFVVITDGYISTEKELFQTVHDNLGNANIFCFGIGSSVNRYLVDGIAKAGRGESFVVLKPSDAAAEAQRFLAYVGRPLLTDIHLEAQGFDTSDVEPQGIPDLLADRPIVLLGKWRGPRRGTLRLTGRAGAGPYLQTFDVSQAQPTDANAALRYTWARERIAALDDYGGPEEEVKPQLVELGLRYELLTRYTSFIAVSEEVRTTSPGGTVQQPLPLPAGVEETAVGGGEVAQGDEPSLSWILAAAMVLFVCLRGRHVLA
jgi:Ca-activated chloride channel family protein